MFTRLLRKQRGNVMVEFALVAPLFVTVLLGIMVMGIVVNSKIVVAGAAREAGRTFAVIKSDVEARTRAAEAIAGGGLKFKLDNGYVLFDPAHDVRFLRKGDYVEASVTYRQPTFVPLIAKLIDPDGGNGYITLKSQATFRVER